MKVAIIGSRSFNNYDLLKFKLLPYRASITEIISGGASGADSLAEIYSKENGIKIKIFHADWECLEEPCKIKYKNNKPYNSLAGFNRNNKIIDCSDFIIIFWDGISPGTRDSMKKAHQKKKDMLIVYF